MPRKIIIQIFGCLLLVTAGAFTYARSLDTPFIFDDYAAIIHNPTIKQVWPLSVPLNPGNDRPTTQRYLVNLSFAANYAFGEYDTRGYHVFNLACHLVSSLLLFALLQCVLRTPRLSESYGVAAMPLAFCIALIWVAHPLHTETVVYLTQRTELMGGLFLLMTMLFGLFAWQSKHSAAWTIAAIVAALVGICCKQIVAVAPLLMIVFDRTVLADSFKSALRKRWPLYAGLTLTWVVLAFAMATSKNENVGATEQVTHLKYLFTQAGVLIFYLRQSVWPTGLSIVHYWPVASDIRDAMIPGLPIAIMLLATTIAIARGRPIGFLGAWFFLILAPSSSILPIPTEIAAERRMYLPLITVVVLVVLVVYPLMRRSKIPVLVMSIVIAGVLAATSIHRIKDYSTEFTIWEAALDVDPENPQAHLNLGTLLVQEQRHKEAAIHYRRSIYIRPTALAYHNLGLTLGKLGRPLEAIEQYHESLKLEPSSGKVWGDLGAAQARSGKMKQALESLQRAVAIDPDNANAHANLGGVHLAMRQPAEAERMCSRAIELDAVNLNAYVNRATARGMTGNAIGTIADLRTALKLNPNHVDAHFKLGMALLAVKQRETAIKHLTEVLRLNPNHPTAKRVLEKARPSP